MSKGNETLAKLRDLPDEELRETLAKSQDELFRLRLGTYTNQVASTAAVRTKRREVAKILTILRGRELELESQGAKHKSTETSREGA